MLRLISLLLPALIPSWRFFKTVAPSPRVEYRVYCSGQAGDWQEVDPRPMRVTIAQGLQRLVWNPHWNEQLFMVSCSERLIEVPTPHSFEMIARRVAAQLPDHVCELQFRLVFVSRVQEQIVKSVEYESAWVSLREWRA